jgi:hypothetical protein
MLFAKFRLSDELGVGNEHIRYWELNLGIGGWGLEDELLSSWVGSVFES